MKTFPYILSLLAVLSISGGASEPAKPRTAATFPSPDGKFVAEVIQLPKMQNGGVEDRVEVRSAEGKTMGSHSYSSTDRQHGFGIRNGAWTPDSKFFVYQLASSGGHQPWHNPIDFVSTEGFKIRSLDNATGPITGPDFKVLSPDVVSGSAGSKKDPTAKKPFSVKLSAIMKNGP